MRTFTLWAAAVLLAGCAASSSRTGARSDGEPEAAALADAARQAAESSRAGYKIAPDDLLSMAVYQDHQLDVRVRVDGDGAVSLPLAGTVTVAGATVSEAERLIAGKLSAYLVNPQVSLLVESTGVKQLFVLGEVQKPGPYPIPSGARVTVLQAITEAGGFTKVAAPRRTHVLRYEDGKSVDYKIDVKTLIRHGERDKDMALEPNDVVYVPQSLF